jgi:hypothetical protein
VMSGRKALVVVNRGDAEPSATMRPKGKHNMPHTHQYTIADDEAVEVLVDKLISHGSHQQRREKLLKALDDASQ